MTAGLAARMATALATPQAATPLPRARPGTSRAKLSNHLTCLRDCGLVTATAEGRHVRYDLADPTLADALRLLTSLNLPGTCDR